MFENIKVEQFIETTNPTRGGAFGIVSTTSGFDSETKNLIKNDARIISSLIRGNYDAVTTSDRVLKPTAKANFLGKFKDKDYEWKEREVRGEIEIVAENQSGPLLLRGDYRNTPEQAPYKIAKTKLGDGRTVVLRVSGIGRVYSDIDTREGNYFCHGIIFPAGVTPTNEQIMQIDFQKGLTPYEWNKETFKIDPNLSSSVPTKQQVRQPVTNTATKPNRTIPPLVFTRAKQIREWKKQRDELSSIQNPDSLVVMDITDLNRKIDQANSYIRETLKNYSMEETTSIVRLHQEKLMVDAEINAMEKGLSFDAAEVKKSDDYRATQDILFIAKGLKREGPNI